MGVLMERILDDHVVGQVREAFAELKEPVEILFFGSEKDCEYCETTRQLLEEVSAIHSALSFHSYSLEADQELASKFGVDKAPCMVIAGKDEDGVQDLGIRFAGIPSGHEFSTLISDIIMVSKRDSGLDAKTREYLKTLDQPLLLQVFVTPT